MKGCGKEFNDEYSDEAICGEIVDFWDDERKETIFGSLYCSECKKLLDVGEATNMREIKFRVWSIHLNEMRYDILNIGNFDREFWAWMQYTGLKDKNGKEIYEGDIVKVHKPYFENPNKKGFDNLAVVKFEDGIFKGDDGHHSDPDVNLNFVGIEVIGNKFENQELLNLGKVRK